MFSLSADILGSPDFPTSAIAKGIGHIRIFTTLYERYSRLNFTFNADRAVAIAALEMRLFRVFNTTGVCGILKKFLGQSLLWRRDQEDTLERIQFPDHQSPVPSWSWMAYTGGINYFDLDIVDWHPIELFFDHPRLIAQAQEFDVKKITNIFYDVIRNADREDQECVVVGTSKWARPAYYLLIVAPEEGSEVRWERLGIAYTEDEGCVSLGKPSRSIEIF